MRMNGVVDISIEGLNGKEILCKHFQQNIFLITHTTHIRDDEWANDDEWILNMNIVLVRACVLVEYNRCAFIRNMIRNMIDNIRLIKMCSMFIRYILLAKWVYYFSHQKSCVAADILLAICIQYIKSY